MVEFEGTYFDGKSAKPHQVKVIGDKTRIRIKEKTGELPEIIVLLAACKFTPPLGHTRRSIILPDNARCETDHLKALAVMETLTGAGRWVRIIDLLESRWKIVLACLTVLVLIVWGLTILGIPFLARKAADAVPFAVTQKLSNQTLAMLEKQYFGPSELDPKRSNQLKIQFQQIAVSKSLPEHFRLEFRKGHQIGPNAFALPSGLMLMTDELVALSEFDQELIAVMVHEMTHAEKKHGLRILFQNAGAFILLSTLLGDAASITALAGSLPALLINSGYSRRFEQEADHAAGAYLIHRGWGTEPFQNILIRISENSPTPPAFAIFSSHPELEARLHNLRDMNQTQ